METHVSNVTAGHPAGAVRDLPGPAGANEKAAAPKMLMWTLEEELVISTTEPPSRRTWSLCGRGSVTLMAFASMCAALLRVFGLVFPLGFGSKHMLPMAQKEHFC